MDTREGTCIESDIERVKVSADLRRSLESVKPALSRDCCIYRIADITRESNPNAYTPGLVSIGPLHHGRPHLEAREHTKQRFLIQFLERGPVSLEDCVKLIQERESRIRDCYSETIPFTSQEFVKLILVDGAFVVEYCLRWFLRGGHHLDGVFNKPRIYFGLAGDMLLLENQVPFFILEDLFELLKKSNSALQNLSMVQLVLSFCRIFWALQPVCGDLRRFAVASPVHLLDFIWISVVPVEAQPRTKLNANVSVSATKLHHSGVSLKQGQSNNLFDIRFQGGTLTIPQLRWNGTTQRVFWNLLLFERFEQRPNYINDYVAWLNYLINSSNDVELLSLKQVINHRFDVEEVSNTVHKLYERCVYFPDNFYFASVINDLSTYCQKRRRRWKATLKQDYFNTPWACISVIAAFIALLLTSIQTLCSIIECKRT